MKTTLSLLLLSLLWCLVEVRSQNEYPYVSFMGEDLPNHAYVDLTQVGDDDSDPGNTVRCHTDLNTCCTSSQGLNHGDWYFPDGERLMIFPGVSDIYESRGDQRVDVHRNNNAFSPSGIYRCVIPTVDVHSDTDLSVGDTVYVGLYSSGGNSMIMTHSLFGIFIFILGDVTILVVYYYINGPQFTITCNSTGGPATTVTWTRDSVTITEGTETVYNSTTALYTHTLTGVIGGNYTCTVANNKPSTDSASIMVEGKGMHWVTVGIPDLQCYVTRAQVRV